MYIPEYVANCMDLLSQAGFQAWAVGGYVRDSLLGLSPHDYDLCTDAKPDETMRVFSGCTLVTAGIKHGTVGVVTSGGVVEITTFRQDGDYSDSRHPDRVAFVTDIREDLARRDFTINAMACGQNGTLCDPFGGRRDLLERHVLCTVGTAETRFHEDALRILRGVRFSLRFRLTPEAETRNAMLACVPLLDTLSRERVYSELCGILPLLDINAMACYAPILTRVIPELSPTVGFDQHSPHHKYDLYTHISHVVAAVPDDLALRWAALLHDIGKISTFTRDENGRGHFYGHAEAGAKMADDVLRRLKAPNTMREKVVLLVQCHMQPLMPERKLLRRAISRLGRELVGELLLLQEADMGSKGTGENCEDQRFDRIRAKLSELDAEASLPTVRDLAVNGRDLLSLGLSGREIGQCLDSLLQQVVEETVPNEQQPLLDSAGQWIARNKGNLKN